jgi:Leucine-rich repeat (LRR) protein
MQSNQLTGAIPATLGELAQLRRLDLSFNTLFGSIPSKIAEVPLLEVFDVRNNTLSGSVPLGNKPLLLRLKSFQAYNYKCSLH